MSHKGRIRKHSSEHFYQQIPDSIKRTFSSEQRDAVRLILDKAIERPSQKVIDARITFWLIRRFYLVLFFGFDRRESNRPREQRASDKVVSKIMMLSVYVLIVGLFLLFSVFGLFMVEIISGLQILPDKIMSIFS